MKNILYTYYEDNKRVLKGFLIFTLLFYLINFLFFRHSNDIPADLIFTIGYIIFVPGIVTFTSLLISDLNVIYESKTFFKMLLIHILIPILISLIIVFIYSGIRMYIGYWQNILFLHLLSISVSMIGAIIAFEIKMIDGLSIFRMLGYTVLVVTYLIIGMNIRDISAMYQSSVPDYTLNGVYFYLLPGLLIGLLYRKKVIAL